VEGVELGQIGEDGLPLLLADHLHVWDRGGFE
jgi:hypothetical protein